MAKKWKLLKRIVHLKSDWVTVYADKLLDDKGKELEYWHYVRADSVVVIVVQGTKLVLPAAQYRVGVDQVMLDFAGSRVQKGQSPEDAATAVIERELGVDPQHVAALTPINSKPFAVDSSFSSQKLWGYVAIISSDAKLKPSLKYHDVVDMASLRNELLCAQCRLLLSEFILGLSK